jgi:uncharacterized iron-regulated membrane protein
MKKLRPLLLKLHRWMGLSVGLLLLIQGLTGTVIVFRDEIDRVIHPEIVVAPGQARLPVQRIVDIARAAHPDETITRVELSRWADGAALVKLTAPDSKTLRIVSIDPFRGTVLRDGGLGTWPMELMFQIHYTLLAGDIGETIVGIEGLALLFMAITGPIVWWPGLKRMSSGFRVMWRGNNDRRWRSLHRAWGAAAALLLILSATTGVLMVWKEEARSVLRVFGPVTPKPTPKVEKIPGQAMMPIDRLVARAQAEYGDTPLRQIRFSSGGRVVAVFLDSDLTVRADGTKQIYYNAYTGADLGHYVAGALPAGSEIIDWLYTIHTGMFGGVPTQLLFLLAALSLTGLSGSGLWLWYSRRRQRSRKRASRPPATPIAETN